MANCDSRATAGGFLDSIEDIFSALLIAGAVVSVRNGALSVKTKPGVAIPSDVGRAAAHSKLALTVHASSICARCGADQGVEHGRGYVMTWCGPCELTEIRRRHPGQPMGFFVEYAERANCKTCPRVGPTHNGWCLWCLAKREGVDWDERLEAEMGETAGPAVLPVPSAAASAPPSPSPASTGPIQPELFR